MNYGLSKKEKRVFDKLDTPQKIQDFLDQMPINFERTGETLMSPRLVLQKNKAHCIEAALLAAAVLWHHGQKPLLLDLVADKKDFDHVVCLFRQGGYWGAISKSNHAVLRWRDPVYRTVRELAMSYYHEYFLPNGAKSLKTYSAPFDLRKFRTEWVTSEKKLMYIGDALDRSPHFRTVEKKQEKNLRKADRIMIKAGRLKEWKGKKKLI
jgi:hypothetical protein